MVSIVFNAQTIELTTTTPLSSTTTAGGNSTHVGAIAGYKSTGDQNSFFGYQSGVNNTIGGHNVFLGSKSGISNVSGGRNVFVGRGTGFKNSSGNFNVYIGNNSAYNSTTASFNTFIGALSGVSARGNENVMLGYYSGSSNNSLLGKNTFLGAYSGQNNTGENNVFIGYKSGQSMSGSNKLVIANSNTTSPIIYGEFDNEKLLFNATVGIGTSNFVDSTYRLYVKDGIRTEKVKVDIAAENGWADYVFEKDYQLDSLEEVEKFIKENGHLKNIPSAEEVVENGVELAEMNKLLLQKIEELTLYTIQLKKEIEVLKDKVD
ncbi:hypothetical protein MHTCC0001_25420 [Flavobacteriaceae bacterium MHTCC 0001]